MANEIRQEAEKEGTAVEIVLQEALREYRRRSRERKIRAEREAWLSLPAEERRRYQGEYVAVHQGNVVDHDSDRSALHGRVRQKYGNTAVLITPANGRPDMVIRSPQLER